jgi:hypothetical protein
MAISRNLKKTPKRSRKTPKRSRKTPKRSRKTPKRSRKTPKRSRKTPKRSRKTPKRSKSRKLIKIVKSPKKEKKYRAYFSNGKHTDFGASGMSDYTKHKDPERKKRYIIRHKKNENWKDPTTAGALSRWVLWNKPSFRASVSDYKKRFNL